MNRGLTFLGVILIFTCAAGALQRDIIGQGQRVDIGKPPEPIPPQPPQSAMAGPALNGDAIPKQELIGLYRQELGDRFDPAQADKLYEAHLLLEKYFAAKNAERPAIVKSLTDTGLDANLVGRIARIRLYWPQLKEGCYYVNERVGPLSAVYFVGVPKNYDRSKSWPLVVQLPGVHAFIADPPPNADKVVQIYKGWIDLQLQLHPDAVIVMPLLNLDELWGPSTTGMNNAIQPILHVAGRLNIDPRRVYMLGHAMSGHAVWNLSIHYPTYLAAINPMTGGASVWFQTPRLKNLRNIYSVVWHDADDKIIPVKESQQVVKQLRAMKYDVDYEETKGIGHAPSEQLIDKMYDKMRARSRELYPREVVIAVNRPERIFNRNDWIQVYQQVSPGKEEQVKWQIGSGFSILYRANGTATAKIIAPNKIEVRSSNIESMRVLLNDQMVDFSKPITVSANGRTRFEGIVKPSMEEMLADQVLLGRGWRYFSGYADIDYGATTPDTPAERPKQ